MSSTILKYFPGEPRPQQVEALLKVEKEWDNADIFILQLPVSTGKSRIAVTIARWAFKEKRTKGNILVPTNVLLEQYKSEFTKMHYIQRKDLYKCKNTPDAEPLETSNCDYSSRMRMESGDKKPQYCPNCCYLQTVKKSHSSPYMLANYWSYMALRLYKPLAIFDECFPKSTLIRLANGKVATIGSIVKDYNAGKHIEVMAWNGTAFMAKQVTAAWCSGEKELVRVDYHRGSFTCTPEHKILTTEGYVQASHLTPTHRLIAEKSDRAGLATLTEVQKQVVYGSKLGDGYLRKDTHCKYGARLNIRHGVKQLEYLKFKAGILGTKVVQSGKSGYTEEVQYVTQTKYMDVGVTKLEALTNLDKRGLAIWFCDDGSVGRNPKTGHVNSGRLHVESWDIADITLAQSILRSRFGVETSLIFYKDKKYPVLYLKKKDIEQLLDVIGEAIPECMGYKKGTREYNFNSTLWEDNVPDCKVVPVIRVQHLEKKEEVYDITVEGLHNFVVVPHRTSTCGIVVHNCHNLASVIRGLEGKTLWRREYKYPSNVTTYQTLLDWVTKNPETKTSPKLRLLKEELETGRHRYLIEKGFDLYRGQEQECLKMLPLDISNAKPVLWPHGKVRKMVLMSATFSEVDLEMLGLQKRRICVISTSSPIPPEQRPVIFKPIVNSSHAYQATAAIRLATFLKELADSKPGQKGFVHCTYALADKLRQHLAGDTRFLFHDAESKMEMYAHWRSQSSGIFIGCGLSEGIDLAGKEYGWQVLAKAQYANLAEPAIKYQAEEKPKDYVWNALRECAQACGRICRTPTDYGETILVDSTFKKLFTQAKQYGIVPMWLDEQLANKEELYGPSL